MTITHGIKCSFFDKFSEGNWFNLSFYDSIKKCIKFTIHFIGIDKINRIIAIHVQQKCVNVQIHQFHTLILINK